MWTDKAKQIKLRDPPNTSATFFYLTFPSRTVQQWFINKKPLYLRQNMIFSSLIIDTVLVLGNVQHRLAWATMLTAALLLLPLSTTQWNSSQAAASTSFSHCCNEITQLYHHTRVSHRWVFFSLISRSYLNRSTVASRLLDLTQCSYTTASAGPSRPIWARRSFPANHKSAQSDLKGVRPGVTTDVTGESFFKRPILLKMDFNFGQLKTCTFVMIPKL